MYQYSAAANDEFDDNDASQQYSGNGVNDELDGNDAFQRYSGNGVQDELDGNDASQRYSGNGVQDELDAPAARRARPKRTTSGNHYRVEKNAAGTSPKTPTASGRSQLKSRKSRSSAPPRSFVCSFAHYGCPSTFSSKGEWKRHVSSQHLQLGYYRCDVDQCVPENVKTKKDRTPHSRTYNDFNRKDLFTQHQRRMHGPYFLSKKPSQQAKDEFETTLEEVRERCWHQNRQAPQLSMCGFCRRIFSGPSSWGERMEHVGKHYEKGEGEEKEDKELREWAISEGLLRQSSKGSTLTWRLKSLKDDRDTVEAQQPNDEEDDEDSESAEIEPSVSKRQRRSMDLSTQQALPSSLPATKPDAVLQNSDQAHIHTSARSARHPSPDSGLATMVSMPNDAYQAEGDEQLGASSRQSRTAAEPQTGPSSDAQADRFYTPTADSQRSRLVQSTALSSTKIDMEMAEVSDSDAGSSDEDPLSDSSQHEERLSDPREYFRNLAEIERTVYNNSAFRCYRPRSHPLLERPPIVRQGILALRDRTFSQETIDTAKTSTLFLHLAECYDILLSVHRNLIFLQESRYCGEYFSIIVMDKDRERIAKLRPISVTNVKSMIQDFGGFCEKNLVRYRVQQGKFDLEGALMAYESGNSACRAILAETEVLPQPPLPLESLWRHTAHLLDLGILSYAAAHIERIDEKHLGFDLPEIPILGPFHNCVLHASIQRQGCVLNLITMRRRKLQCLDQFLAGKEIWVFESSSSAISSEPLFLSTNAQHLADIWGPLWETSSPTSPDEVLEYSIGNGYIVPWTRAMTEEANLSLGSAASSEVFCHWVSDKDWNATKVDEHLRRLPRKSFLRTDTLLIGADVGLHVNESCRASIGDIKDSLRRSNALRPPRTSRSRRYFDGYTVQMSGGAAGFGSLGGSLTYKRQAGFNMKDTLVERWRNGLRNTADLEAFFGVEVSLCTRNARRRRLWQILGSSTMCNYLKGNSFEWKDKDCEIAYFKALSDHKKFRKRFRRLWSRQEWRSKIGDAISVCLDALVETGIDDETGELSALWVQMADAFSLEINLESGDSSSSDASSGSESDEGNEIVQGSEEWIVRLVRSEHTWTGFLRDSPETLTLAVVEKICLSMHEKPIYGWERCCLAPRQKPDGSTVVCTPGYPVLETSLLINEDILKNEGLRYHRPRVQKPSSSYYWETKNLKENCNFSLGDQGNLTLYRQHGAQLIMDWKPCLSETWRSFRDEKINAKLLGKGPGRHHLEYMRGTWRIKPLAILVLSESTK